MRAAKLILVLLVTALLFGQDPPALPRASIRVDTNLVLVPVTVIDQAGRMVTGLDPEDFQVFEDGVQQKLASFGSEDAPLSIGIVLDTSGSMGNKLTISRAAVGEFFRSANPEDEAFLVEFNNQPELVTPFTHDLGEIESRIMFTRSKGQTALLDGITLSIAQMKKAAHPRKALILVSDGGDNHSRYTEAEVRNRVKESDVQIYAMGIFSGGGDINDDPDLLNRLATLTGGRHFETSLRDMADVAEKIGIELRNTYLLGYMPANIRRDGKYRAITVKVAARGVGKLTASWRRGYFAPTQ
ncbi:MAG TPA: VWA domain-containing protein [Bryobacteraceae bacterium]|nr:VWA domain-containing protein [Bryobacteraceae bacterium]